MLLQLVIKIYNELDNKYFVCFFKMSLTVRSLIGLVQNRCWQKSKYKPQRLHVSDAYKTEFPWTTLLIWVYLYA